MRGLASDSVLMYNSAYLAMHRGVAHWRSALAGLLWPEQSNAEALRNLRVALGDCDASTPFFLAARTTLQLKPEADWWLDARAFRDLWAEVKAHRCPRLDDCDLCAQHLSARAMTGNGLSFVAAWKLDHR